MVVAALAGALGAAGVLLARERLVLLGGLALLAVAEVSARARRRQPRLAELGHRAGGRRRWGWWPWAWRRRCWSATRPGPRSPCWPRRPSACRSRSTPEAAGSRSRSPRTASSAACCRSTSCWARPSPPWPGARCAARGRAPCRARWPTPPRRSWPSAACRCCGPRSRPPARTCSASSCCPSGCCWRWWPGRRCRPGCRGASAQLAVGLAALFAVVGLYQAVTQQLFFFAPNVQTANANGDFFRVTSLFVDPSLYGRHVVLGLGVLLVALALARVSLRGAWPWWRCSGPGCCSRTRSRAWSRWWW